jgi:uncharacterized protein YraI
MINIFVSYSHRDQIWFVKDSQYDLIPWLQDALRRDDVRLWYDRSDEGGLRPGDEFRREIERQIDNAQITLLMLSEAFFSSDFIQKVEVPRIMALVERKQMVVIPILLEPCDWDDFDYVASRQMVPGKPTPLIKFTDKLSDWVSARVEILSAIRKRVGQIAKETEMAAPMPPPLPPVETAPARVSEPAVAAVPSPQRSRPRWLLAGIPLAILVVIVGIWLAMRTLNTATSTPPAGTTTLPAAATEVPVIQPAATPSLTITTAPTATALPTATFPPPSPTPVPPTATSSLTPSSTPTLAPQAVVAVEQANVRGGPGTEYPIIAAYPQGAAMALTGRNRSGTWLVVRGPDGRTGWMAITTLRVTGDVSTLPETAAPPTPTPSPTPPWTATPTPQPTQTATAPAPGEQPAPTSRPPTQAPPTAAPPGPPTAAPP